MPKKDKTGPEGLGPLTGRGLGECVKEADKKTTNPKDVVEKILGKKI